MKIFIVGNATAYSNWIEDCELVNDITIADIVIFTGGEDVDPSLYGCEKHHTTGSYLKRDLEEKEIFEKVRPDQLCLGICRGSQFLCVMNGGMLIQHCNNHAMFGTHPIINMDCSEEQYEITSTHHQMQYPFNLPHKDFTILYVSQRRADYYEGDKIGRVPVEPEVVLYHVKGKPKCLAIQGHPEIMRPGAPVIKMLNQLIKKYVSK